MAHGRTSFKMGTVEMLALFLLDKRDLYGYEIVSLIRTLSEENLDIAESTLYPTLYKLIDKNYITYNEVRTGRRRIRVYYHIEEAGRERLAELLSEYRRNSIGIEKVLACTALEENNINEPE